MDRAAYARGARISKQFKVVKKTPTGAFRDDLAKAAVAQLRAQGVDVVGNSWKKVKIAVTQGGR